MAIDNAGNIFVTGGSLRGATGRDYLTVKYDRKGNRKWFASYDHKNDLDEATAIAVHSSSRGSFVYVTGFSDQLHDRDRVLHNNDFATIKYDGADGRQLWVKRYDNTEVVGLDAAKAIAAHTDGSVYVTGFSENAVRGRDYLTVRYDARGNKLWDARHGGEPWQENEPVAIALDVDGAAYVTGSYRPLGIGRDYATVKYDAYGNELWAARYGSPGFDDSPVGVAVDAEGNVYVTGTSGHDYATVKYDAHGNELWVVRYDGAGGFNEDAATAIALDPTGTRIYVTGHSRGWGDDYATVKYDADGNELWVARYTSPGTRNDRPRALAVDVAGSAYVTGGAYFDRDDFDFVTVKYDANGEESGVVRTAGPAGKADVARAVAVSGGSVYVAGSSLGDSGSDYLTVRYSQDRDGDGLLDEWETEGLDVDGDGTVDLDLPALGADPDHKDLFVEIDALSYAAEAVAGIRIKPTTAVLENVRAAFADVPNDLVDNPDGEDGITFHYEIDETAIALDGLSADWPDAWAAFDRVKRERFGTPAQRADANWKSIRRARLLVYRYCVFTRTYGGGDSSGLAELPGNDLIVTLGHPGWQRYLTGAFGASRRNDIVAGAFMHELGHTLGLRHGGTDDVNFKPNYHSVMNYAWSFPHRNYEASWVLDYSRRAFNDIDESAIDETIGIGGHEGHKAPLFRLIGAEPTLLRTVPESGGADFNGDGDALDTVRMDVNGSGPCGETCDDLKGAEDWSGLVFRGAGASWDDGAARGETTLEGELSAETIRDFLVGVGGGQLPGDCNRDGGVDLSDTICLLDLLFGGGRARTPCSGDDGQQRGDAGVVLMDWNGDASLDLSDAISMLLFFFGDGAAATDHALGPSNVCVPIAGCPDLCVR